MTVIIKYDQHGEPQYRSAKGVGSTDAERMRARQLDAALKSELTQLGRELSKAGALKTNAKGNVGLYWELGNVLRKIFYTSRLIEPSEKHLYWLNAALYVPKELMTKDRGPYRLHLEYCFRLAGYPREKALRMKWGEWSYLFDSPGINREQRFDAWMERKMQGESDKFTRADVRIFVQCTNRLIGSKETRDLSDEQLARCYDAAWFIKERFIAKAKEIPNEELKRTLRSSLDRNYMKFGDVIDGVQEPSAFAALVAEEAFPQK